MEKGESDAKKVLEKDCAVLKCNLSIENNRDGKIEALTLECFSDKVKRACKFFFCSNHLDILEKMKKFISIINEECIIEVNSNDQVEKFELINMPSFRRRLIELNYSDFMYEIILSSYDGNIDKKVTFEKPTNSNFEIFKNVLVYAYRKLESVLV